MASCFSRMLVLGVCACAACNVRQEADEPSVAADAGENESVSSLTLSPSSLELLPGQRVQMLVQASPPRAHRVELFLLGAARQAFLSDLEIYTDSDGIGRFWLAATGPQADFQVGVKSGTRRAHSNISVAQEAVAELRIEPSYSGARTVETWTASVRTRARCDALSDLTVDGPIQATAQFGDFPRLGEVPVGASLAVTLRSGRFVAGCADVSDLLAGEQRALSITASDVPIRYAARDVPLHFDATLDAAAERGFAQRIEALVASFSSSPSDIDLVLDAMRGELTDELSRLSFDNRREHDDWYTALSASLHPDLADQGLRDRLVSWMREGVTAWFQASAFTGTLVVESDAAPRGLFFLDRVSGVPAAQLGFAPTQLALLTRGASDQLQFTLSYYWVASRLFTGLAQLQAGGESMVQSLVELVDCDKLAITLAQPSGSFAFADCSESCTASLCEEALSRAWERLENMSLVPTRLQLNATALVGVDDNAQPVTVTGNWVGIIPNAEGDLTVSGTLASVPAAP